MWRVGVARKGIRLSEVFATKQEARDSAAAKEAEIGTQGTAKRATFAAMLDRYAREVSQSKRGHRWEIYRLEALKKDPLASLYIGALRPKHFADFRDRRPREVKPGTVNREMILMSHVLTIGMRAGEIFGLTKNRVSGSVAHLPRTKNGEKRDVDILEGLGDRDPLFGLTSAQIDAS
ncbi:MAG: hypothetical protein AAFY65_17030 [Pseudomonadota bacterium]